MKFEIEFLAVGSSSRPGDAIIVRYGDPSAYELMVVDGGTTETGETMVAHLKEQFGDHVWLRHVALTHSDADHASGLRVLLRDIPVVNLWLHIPWNHAAESRSLFADKSFTDDTLREAIRQEYDIISDICDLAVAKGCNVLYAFAGAVIGPFQVLSPSRYAYVHLLPQFDKTPEPDRDELQVRSMWLGKMQRASLFSSLFESLTAKLQNWVNETWAYERLRDGGVTSASNESSLVLCGDFGECGRALLTGDAGFQALSWAASYAESIGIPLRDFAIVQIPHHGSRRNVGPTILNRLIGDIRPVGSLPHFAAFVSAPANDDTHPRRMVTNAFIRRGARVIATQGAHALHRCGYRPRAGYVSADSYLFATTVEEYD
jgi:beta-lactamase superfamily II metal-dependent hydrolase